jgi:hypothetical protein
MSVGLTIGTNQQRELPMWARPEPGHWVIGSEPWRWTSNNSTDFVAVTKRRS